MSLDLLSAFTGAAEGLERTSGNLLNIMIAKNDIQRKNELFQIQKKRGELDIKESELNLDPDIVAAKKEKFMLETKLGQLNIKKAEADIKESENKIKKEQQQHEMQMKIVVPLLQGMFKDGGSLPPGLTFRSDGSFTMSGGPVKRQDSSASLEDLLQETPEAPKAGEKETQTETEYSQEQEEMITANMEYHGKTREEIVEALQKKGAL